MDVAARHSIHLEFFIFRPDETGKRVIELLARKAAGGFRPRLLALWLHGVAARTALKARTALARRRAKEKAAAVPI